MVGMRFHAPPLSNELLSALDSADTGRLAIAEINRRVGAAAVRRGKVRPSYELVRRVVHARRLRQYECALLEVGLDVAFHVRVVLFEVALDLAFLVRPRWRSRTTRRQPP
jgi:hypothetical protein